jgi:hypothetical protein
MVVYWTARSRGGIVGLPTSTETRVSMRLLGTCLALAACAACAACASGNKGARAESGANHPDRNVITQQELADPAVSGRNVLEAVRSLRPQFLSVRGTHTLQTTSAADPETGKVHASLDGTKIVSVEELAGINANTVVEIRFLNPAQAMQRFGGAAREGPVIVVKTT